MLLSERTVCYFCLHCGMLLRLHPDNPQPRNIKTITDCLLDGGVIIYPTDTIYGLGCDIFQHKAIERICRIKNIEPAKAQLSFICYDLSDLSKYTKSISTPLYRLLRNHLPGPYTFILPASKQVPKILKSRKNIASKPLAARWIMLTVKRFICFSHRLDCRRLIRGKRRILSFSIHALSAKNQKIRSSDMSKR